MPALMIGALVVFVAAAVWDVLTSGAPAWALTEPLGVLALGGGPTWFPGQLPWAYVLFFLLFGFGGYLTTGYRHGSVPRQPRRLSRPRRRQKLPPL
ncbi:hypothetical protein SAMN05216267_102421 [Actinacidiphila rubida]|uniref:Uncharacterized protein n=2 Tax=Actinacidiphila rubida TaxID=310780 RepID=A0A1H8NZU7_9ACTN|nr:hypothetical protein SAMN05216267_102421 [Actinacidiphila rubida]